MVLRLNALLGVALVLALGATGIAGATTQDGDAETLRLDYGEFVVNGSQARHACSAQANLISRDGKQVGFALYWRIGKDMFLLVSHPGNRALTGLQKISFVFDDGRKVVFPMQGHGNQLQVPIGLGPRGASFYSAIKKNDSLRIVMPGVGDEVRLDVSRRAEVERAMQICKRWVK